MSVRSWLDSRAVQLPPYARLAKYGVYVQYADSPIVAKWALPQCDVATLSLCTWWSGLWWYLCWWHVMKYPARLLCQSGVWAAKEGCAFSAGHLQWPDMWSRQRLWRGQ